MTLINVHIVSIDPLDSRLIMALKPMVISIDIKTPLPALATAAASPGSMYVFLMRVTDCGMYSVLDEEFLTRS